jgi:hypothetical protein
MKRLGLALALYALLEGIAPAHVSLPFPGPGGIAGSSTSCAGANFELDYSNNCNLVYTMTVAR